VGRVWLLLRSMESTPTATDHHSHARPVCAIVLVVLIDLRAKSGDSLSRGKPRDCL
jgi:hypothetical protein